MKKIFALIGLLTLLSGLNVNAQTNTNVTVVYRTQIVTQVVYVVQSPEATQPVYQPQPQVVYVDSSPQVVYTTPSVYVAPFYYGGYPVHRYYSPSVYYGGFHGGPVYHGGGPGFHGGPVHSGRGR